MDSNYDSREGGIWPFLPDPGVSGVRSMGPVLSISESFGWDFTDVTLADDDTNSILADYANRAIWGWWLSSNRWWSSPMWAWRSPRGSARWWYRSCMEYWSWWAVIMLATIYVVGALQGNGFHWDGGGREGLQGGAQGVKGGYQVAEEGLKCSIGICICFIF